MAIADEIDKNTQNAGLEALRLAVQMSYSQFGMVDGIGDVFTDETGIDTGASTSQTYDATGNYYTSFGPPSDGDTNFYDRSSNGATITTQGDAQVGVTDSPYADKSSYAMGFSESDSDAVVVTHDSNLDLAGNNFKISMWLKPDAGGTGDEVVIYKSAGSPNREFQLLYDRTNDRMKFFWSTDGSAEVTNQLMDASSITKGAWNYIEIIRNGTGLEYYVGGVSASTGKTISGSIASGGNTLQVGYFSSSFGFDGKMVDVRIEKHASNTFSSSVPTTKPTLGSEDLFVSASSGSSGAVTEEAGRSFFLVGDIEVNTDPYGGSLPTLLLDITGDRLEIPDSDDWSFSGDFSIRGKFNADGVVGNQVIISQWLTSQRGWMLRLEGDEIYWYYNVTPVPSGFERIGSTALNIVAGTWYEFHVRRSGSDMEIYINGSSVASVSENGSFYNSTHIMQIGASESGTSDEFGGRIADVEIYNSAQSTTVTTSRPAVGSQDFYLGFGKVPNMELVSGSTTASEAPTTARAVVLYDPVDVATLNTDATLSVSMDGGSTYSTAFTLSKNADYDSNVEILITDTLTLDSTSGTSMVYKWNNLNDKEIRLHGVFLQWA